MSSVISTDRRHLKTQLVEAERGLEHYRELLKHKAELEAAKDAAANKHSEATAPLQQALRSVEDAIVARVVDREDADPALEARRKAIIADIEVANLALKKEIADLDSRIELLDREVLTMIREMPNPDVVKAQLFRCGKQTDVVRHEALTWVATQLRLVTEGAQKYRERAEEYVAMAAEDRLVEPELTQAKLTKWTTILDVLRELSTQVRTEAETLRTKIIES